ncbi:VanZ family protein [Sinimarinibacterium thermocellulolyticum]|uniref:VanZ family protein n=1 Tax=Sinimarinibacterium thermocellulolyticum TaxID=3170016 RepID=A0ABV2ABP3_9GAMM
MSRSTLLRAAWIAAMLVVGATALIPTPQLPALPAYADKLVHLGSYLVLGALAVLAQNHHRHRVIAAIAMIGFGILIELVQARLPWRSFEWADIGANVAGVSLGAGMVWLRTRSPKP